MNVPHLRASAALCCLASALLTATTLAQRPVLTGSAPTPSVLTPHVPALVTTGHATRLKPSEPTDQLELTLSLPLRHEDQLDALLADLYNPASSTYHYWLSSPEFEARFGPPREDIQTLVAWAKAKGLTVTYIAENGRLINITAPVKLIDLAFNVTLTQYRDNLTAREFHAPDREPTTDLPLSLWQISNLEDSVPKIAHNIVGKKLSGQKATNATNPIQPNDTIPGSGGSYSGYYLASDMRAAYYGTGALNGSGQTVGIFSFDGYATSDITGYYTFIGKANSTVPITNVLVGSYNGACTQVTSPTSNNCNDVEQASDIVAVQGMVPSLSSIRFYEATTAAAELNQMATDNLAKVITSSWSGADFGTASDTYFKQMAAQGQSYLNATGDSGGYNSSTYTAPGLDPYITEVGGTDLGTASAGGPWSSETGWTGSGGGFYASAGQAIPTWQQTSGVITAANAGSTTYRNSPDIAADANQDSVGYFQTGNGAAANAYVVGGTSLATPRYAGYLAMANQQSVANGGSTLGFINPALYALGLGSNAATVYHDITTGSNASAAGTPVVTYSARAGYDLVTGWGSPKGTGLINALAPLTGQSFTMAASGPLTIVRGNTGTSTVTITAAGGFTGAVALTAMGLPPGVTAAFSAPSTTSTSTLTFTVSATALVGTYPLTIAGTSDALAASTPLTLNILKRTNGDFTIIATNASTLYIPGNTTSTVTLTYGSGFSGTVDLTVTGLPPHTNGTFDHTSLDSAAGTGTSTLTLSDSTSQGMATYTVTVTGTAEISGLTHSATFTVTLVSP